MKTIHAIKHYASIVLKYGAIVLALYKAIEVFAEELKKLKTDDTDGQLQ